MPVSLPLCYFPCFLGKNTALISRHYFDGFNLPTLRVTCIGLGGGNAEHLLKEALCLMRLPKYSGYDHYCLVFDCDDNSQEELLRVAV